MSTDDETPCDRHYWTMLSDWGCERCGVSRYADEHDQRSRDAQRAADIKVLEALRDTALRHCEANRGDPRRLWEQRVCAFDSAIAALRSGTPTKEAQDE